MAGMDIKVDCYAGYRGEETPRSVRIGDNTIEVIEILDRWLSPDHRYFKFLGDDSAVYIVRHDQISQKWEVTFYKNR
jgi:hypothetical protein